MGTVGGRAAAAALVLLVALAGCADAPDRARVVEGDVVQLDGVADATVTAPTADRVATVTVTYNADVDDPDALTTLIADVADVADAAEAGDITAYRLTLVPALDPDSALVVDQAFTGRGEQRPTLDGWLRASGALLGPVTHVVDDHGERLTVASGGGAAHDLAVARRLKYGAPTTTWVFESGAGTFTVSGRVTRPDLALFDAVQRAAGSDARPVWAESWALDRRDRHVRLDLDLALTGAPVSPAQLTVDRYGSQLAPVVDSALTTLAATGLPAWVRLRHVDAVPADVIGSWSSVQRAAAGRDPLARGWDTWLASRATTR